MQKSGFVFTIFLLSLSIQGQVAGRYTDGKDYAVYFEQTRFGLTIKPVLWTATQLLKETTKDHYVVIDRTSRGADFRRDERGRVTGVAIRGMDGEGLKLVRSNKPLLPVELFLFGRTHEAADAYKARRQEGLATALETAEQVLERLPTKTKYVIAFLTQLAPQFQTDARFHSLLGFAYVRAGDRQSALTSFRRAYELDAANERAISGLYRLGALPDAPKKDGGWKIPFPTADIFAKPTAAEIKAVADDWAKRDLSPNAIREELKTTISFDGWTANVRVVSHLVHGTRHYGAIIIPRNAKPGCCAVIVDAKGVSPSYFPLTVESVDSVAFMDKWRDQFIYLVPSFRGEVMNIGGKTFKSEGDRRDALDGATDDAIALLNVALQTTPEADPKRICVYGRSRGGNVALLMGERDPRIKCVVNVSGPTDWFYLMGTGGWTEEELWKEGIRTHADPMQTGGQNIERFLGRAIEGKADLAAVRHNMNASSPLYFAERLPLIQIHYGLEDPSVPSRNGYELVKKLKENKVRASRYQAFFYPDQGHDTDRLAEPEAARNFILQTLKIK